MFFIVSLFIICVSVSKVIIKPYHIFCYFFLY